MSGSIDNLSEREFCIRSAAVAESRAARSRAPRRPARAAPRPPTPSEKLMELVMDDHDRAGPLELCDGDRCETCWPFRVIAEEEI